MPPIALNSYTVSLMCPTFPAAVRHRSLSNPNCLILPFTHTEKYTLLSINLSA